MAFENLIVRRKRQIGGITIDGVITESTVRTMRMTNHPVEDGNNVADHVILEPLQYTLEGVVTDTPLGLEGIATTITGVADGVSGIFGQSDSSGQTRSQQVYYELVKLMDEQALLTVDTSLKNYDNLVMETISVVQNKDQARAIFFTATFKQALIVVSSSQEVDADNIASLEDKAGQATEGVAGSVPTHNATGEETALIGGASAQ